MPDYSGTIKDSSKKAEEERIKKELEALKASLEMHQKLLDKYKEAVDLTDFGLDLAEENDFALRADLLNNKMSQLTSYGLAMREEFDRIANIIPETADQADELASHLESLGSDMRSNIAALRETQIAMEQLKIDSIKFVEETYLSDLDRELSNIEKRLEILNGDNKNQYTNTNKILQLEMLLPTASSSMQSVKNKSSIDRGVIETQQETQNILSDMLEKQIEKNESLREEERNALISDLERIRQDIILNLQTDTCLFQILVLLFLLFTESSYTLLFQITIISQLFKAIY